jgi:hypothetical protein
VGGSANFIYTDNTDSKATNDCFKCHGDRHTNTYRLIDADTGGLDSYDYDPAVGMQDNTASGIANANAFCLTCHDGDGADGDVKIGDQVPPNVAANWETSGHGRPQASGAYPVSGNNPAYLKCTACHEVHGSNHAQLLPAKKDAGGNFTIPAAMPEKTFRDGALLAKDIDFTDYSNPSSGKGFGTAGDPGDQRAPSGVQTGLCDACHRFADRANGGTDSVTNKAHTHEGITTDTNQDVDSQMDFAKDCVECHDTHGTTNLEMVRTTIDNVTNVVFTSRTLANSFDPVEAGSDPNVDSVCVVCHENDIQNPTLNVAHNFRTSTVNPDHNEGADCTSCHPHGNAADEKKFGFPQAGCNSCHGSLSDSAGMPAVGDNGVYHPDANNVIGTRGGDNTAHLIHVDYLVNRKSLSRADSCKVCHVGGGSQESHPGNPTNTSFKSGPQPSADNVQVSLDNTGAVFNVQLPGLIASYNGIPGQAAADPNWKSCSNTKCHYALSPSWSAKKQVTVPTGTLTVTDPADNDPAAGVIAAGTDNNAVDKMIWQVDAVGAVTVSGFTISETNTADNTADITNLKVWEDLGTVGQFDLGVDVLVGTATWGGSSYVASGLSYTIPASTSTWRAVHRPGTSSCRASTP